MKKFLVAVASNFQGIHDAGCKTPQQHPGLPNTTWFIHSIDLCNKVTMRGREPKDFIGL